MKRTLFLSSAIAALSILGTKNAAAFPAWIANNTMHTAGISSFVQPINTQSEKSLQAAQDFVGTVTNTGINFLSDDTLDTNKKSEQFEKLLSKNFDLKTIGRFTLGRYWRTTNTQQRKEFLTLFEEMVIESYSQRFKEYKGQTIDIKGAQPTGKSDILVQSLIIPDSGPKIKIDWRVRKKDGQFRIIDIIAEGVSMALTQRSDFASVIQRGGGNVQVLLDHLKQ